MAKQICTACGYEGKAQRALSDHAGEDESLLISVFNKLFFVLTFLPIKFNFLVRLAKRGKAKQCPNCGLPLMVSLKSDAGWLAKRKNDIKAGLVVVGEEKKPAVAFGREMVLPGDEKPVASPVMVPNNLPSLDVMLEEKKTEDAPQKERPVEQVVKKPVDPEVW